jgi:hypothetical protein
VCGCARGGEGRVAGSDGATLRRTSQGTEPQQRRSAEAKLLIIECSCPGGRCAIRRCAEKPSLSLLHASPPEAAPPAPPTDSSTKLYQGHPKTLALHAQMLAARSVARAAGAAARAAGAVRSFSGACGARARAEASGSGPLHPSPPPSPPSLRPHCRPAPCSGQEDHFRDVCKAGWEQADGAGARGGLHAGGGARQQD